MGRSFPIVRSGSTVWLLAAIAVFGLAGVDPKEDRSYGTRVALCGVLDSVMKM